MSSGRSEIDRWLSTDISLGHGPTSLSDIREHIASQVGSIHNSLARAEAREVFLENRREIADSVIYTTPLGNSVPQYIEHHSPAATCASAVCCAAADIAGGG